MSVWHTPQATSRTSTSPAFGSARSISWTASGAPNCSRTAALIRIARTLLPRRGEHPAPVAVRDPLQLGVAVAVLTERLDQVRQTACGLDGRRHPRPVPVGAERDVVDADELGHVSDVLGDPGERRVGVTAAVGPDHRELEVDPDQAAPSTGRG